MNRTASLQHAFNPAKWRPQRQALALITLALFVGIIMGALYLSQAATAATLGRELERLVGDRTTLEQENERIRSEIAALRSVPYLQARAAELGFQPVIAENIEYIVIPGYQPDDTTLNASDALPSVQPLEIAPEPLYEESFSGWLQAQFDSLVNQFQQFAQGTTP
jgi:cell division protein FtsB